MANIQFIPTGFKQTSDICLLSSYSFVLGYYKKIREGVASDVVVYNVCEEYFLYFTHLLDQEQDLERVKQFLEIEHRVFIDANGNIRNHCNYEYFICRILHHYCQVYKNDNIRGYEHIREFDEYLRIQGNPIRSQNFIIEKMDAKRRFLPDAYQNIKTHLDNGLHHMAMIIYSTGSDGHSVVVFKDEANGQYNFRDPNNYGLTDIVSHIDMSFSDQLNISEYVLFSAV